MLYYIVAAIYILNALVLMLVILLQQGKGGDIANAFGGGSSQAAFGARSGATVLSRATTVCAVIFIVGAVALGILGQYDTGSVVGGRAPAPLQQPSKPAAPEPVKPTTPSPASQQPAPGTTPTPSQSVNPASPAPAPAPAK